MNDAWLGSNHKVSLEDNGLVPVLRGLLLPIDCFLPAREMTLYYLLPVDGVPDATRRVDGPAALDAYRRSSAGTVH